VATVAERQPAVKRTSAAEAFSALAIQVLTLSAALQAAGDELARPSGQTSARWQVLAAVEDRPASVATVARLLRLTRQSVQRIADLLVADGLAGYQPNPAHARAKLLTLTPDGLAVLREIQVAQARWANRVAEGLDPRRLGEADEVLAEVQRRLR
jgi:DNA-binding MarR family transcriptional regulator